MQYRIRSKPVARLNRREVSALKKLTLWDGTMKDSLDAAQRGYRRNTRVVMLLNQENRICAWAFLYTYMRTSDPHLHIYVPKRFRRRGFGTRLAKHAFRFTNQTPRCHEGIVGSQKFWESLGQHVQYMG